MGLGKTLQLICFIDVFLQFTKATKVLCIVPMNTIQNWFNEFNMWLPEASEAGETSEGLTKEGQEKQGRTFQVLLLSESVKTTVARSALVGNVLREPVVFGRVKHHCDGGKIIIRCVHCKYQFLGADVKLVCHSHFTVKKTNLFLGKWEKQGGVLLMGYEMYRILAMYTPSLVNNSKLTGSKRKRTNPNTTEVIDLDEEEKNMDLLLGKYHRHFTQCRGCTSAK